MPITVAATTVKLDDPAGYYMVTGTSYTVSWSYTGNLPSVNLAILDPSGAVLQSVQNIPIGSNGKGSWSWSVPVPYGGQSLGQYRFQISSMLPTSVTSNAKTETVFDRTSLFYVRLPKIQVGSFILSQNVFECSPGRTYPITWTSELNGRPVKVELIPAYGGAPLQTIQASVASQANNSISWTVPSMSVTLNRTSLSVRVTSLDFPAAQGAGDVFTCEPPGIKITSPDPTQILVLNQTYQIAWGYQGDPGPHVRIDTLQSDAGGYNMKVYNTPAASTAVQGSSGKRGQGQFSWTPTDRPFGKQFYIMITGVENSSVWDRRQYTIADKSPTGGTSGGTTSTGSTSTTGTGTSSSATQKLLTSDTSMKYNSSSSATFSGGTTVNLDANGYAVNGYLTSKSDQSLYYSSGKSAQFMVGSYVTFGGGYVASGYLTLKNNQSLEYSSGKTAPFLAGALTKFSNGYVTFSILSLTGDQSLEYSAGRSAQFLAGSDVSFSSGYVVSGYLTLKSSQSLYYSSGKTASFMAGSFVAFRSGGYVKSAFVGAATTFSTTKGTQAVPALSYVTFDDNGYLASFNPPGASACYKCDPQMDPTCSNSGGLPPCK